MDQICQNWIFIMGCLLFSGILLHGNSIAQFKQKMINPICFNYCKVSSWGGYVFLINLIPLHVLTLILTGRFSHRIYVAYSTVYCLGTLLSMQIAFVGFQPVQSSEHMLVSSFSSYSSRVLIFNDLFRRPLEFLACANCTLLPITFAAV